MTKEDIDVICIDLDIESYTVNSDLSIDVNDNVDISNKRLIRLPLKFNKVTGYFDCSHNKLISLDGCPNKVTSFSCEHNSLRSLYGCPQEIDSEFICNFNDLTSLNWSPKYIGGNFQCAHNQLTSLEGCPKEIVLELYLSGNKNITSLKWLPAKIGSMSANNLGVIDPYEYRYILFSQIKKHIVIDNNDVNRILRKYYGKPEYYHVAMEDLMKLGESLGFSY